MSATYLEIYGDDQQKELYKRFPVGHFLRNEKNIDHVLQWTTFFRRNPNRLAIDYLGINLHPYQEMLLYEMGTNDVCVVIASRGSAKSWVTALYACCYCITHPMGKFVISASTKDQASLIIDEKIRNELLSISPVLAREIDRITKNNQSVKCEFHNKAFIEVVVAGEGARGHRSTQMLREEFRLMDLDTDTKILSPCQEVRQPVYKTKAPYNSDEYKLLIEEQPTDIYISSSWIDTNNDEFIWHIVDDCIKQVSKGQDACLLAFDESVVLRHGLKTTKQLMKERSRADLLGWQTEYLNLRVKENTRAFFTYNMLNKNRTSMNVWYPKQNIDYSPRKKNPYDILKQYGELRIVSADLAFVAGAKNDASVYTCMRIIPDVNEHIGKDGVATEIQRGYKKIVPYIESHEGMETMEQAIRIRELYEDFNADYIVCDARSAGIAIIQALSKPIFDSHRGVEYTPLCCMNDDKLASYCQSPDANRCLYAMSANAKSNSQMAQALRRELNESHIELLVPFNVAVDSVLNHNKEYTGALDGITQHFYESPFLETQLLVTEMIELEYTKTTIGDIVIKEKSTKRKDHFSSLEYANAFADIVIQELGNNDSYDYLCLVN